MSWGIFACGARASRARAGEILHEMLKNHSAGGRPVHRGSDAPSVTHQLS